MSNDDMEFLIDIGLVDPDDEQRTTQNIKTAIQAETLLMNAVYLTDVNWCINMLERAKQYAGPGKMPSIVDRLLGDEVEPVAGVDITN